MRALACGSIFFILLFVCFEVGRAQTTDPAPYWVYVTVTINSPDSSSMENVTNATDVSALLNSSSNYTILEYPSSQTSIAGTAFSPVVETVLGGFIVDTVAFSPATSTWIVSTRYMPDIPNTVVGMYLTKAGGFPPYSQTIMDSFYPSQHPCVTSSSVCCLTEFADVYTIGSLRENITQVIGDCGSEIQNAETLGMFDIHGNQASVDNLLQDFYPNSNVNRLAPGEVQLVISDVDMRQNISIREEIQSSAYRLKFFVGMSYFTLLPANAISTTVSQYLINVVVANSLTISFATQQDYTFLQYVTASLYQNSWVDGVVIRKMQFVRVGIVLPSGMSQNMETGLVPLGSIRFAIATELPNQADESKWTNPCYSNSGSGMWDPTQPWRAMYESASAQTCSIQKTMCINPSSSVLTSRLSEISIPIGESAIGPEHLLAGAGFSLYIYFDVSIVDEYGRIITTRLFVQSEVGELSISRACEGISMSVSLLEKTQIGLAIGIAGSLENWEKSVVDYASSTPMGQQEGLKTTNKSLSLESGLITLYVTGDPDVFASPISDGYYLEIEHLTSLHFLDPAKFDVVKEILDTGDAYIVVNDIPSDAVSIRLSQTIWDLCAQGSGPGLGSLSCAIRHDIVGRNILNPTSIHKLHSLNHSTSIDWMTENLLGVSDWSKEFASNMTQIVASKYEIDGRSKLAWYIHPGYAWPIIPGGPSQSVLAVSDKLIIIAVISIRDSITGTVVRRRLLQSSTNAVPIPKTHDQAILDSIEAAKNSPAVKKLKPINHDVGAPVTLAKIWGIPTGTPFDLVNISISMSTVPPEWDHEKIWEIVSHGLKSRSKDYCPSCTGVFPVFYNHHSSHTLKSNEGRRNVVISEDFEGTVGVFMTFSQPNNNEISLYKMKSCLTSEIDTITIDSTWNEMGTTTLIREFHGLEQLVVSSSNNQFLPTSPEIKMISNIMNKKSPKTMSSGSNQSKQHIYWWFSWIIVVFLSGIFCI